MFLQQSKALSLLLCLLLACSVTNGRHMGRRHFKERRQLKNTGPLLRSVDDTDGTTGTTSAADPNGETRASPQRLLLLKPTTGESRDASRTFKHMLMVKGLLGSGGWGGGGGGNGGGSGGASNYMVPYIIINTPTNVTNVNDNQLINSPTTPTTGTTAVTGGNRVWMNNAQALPVAVPVQMPMQMPTQVYQQRKNNAPQVASANVMPAMMLGLNDQMIPIFAPPQLQSIGGNVWRGGNASGGGGSGSGGGHRRRVPHNNNNGAFNPFAMLANNLRGIQYL